MRIIVVPLAIAAFAAFPAAAQHTKPEAKGGTVVASEPGKAAAVRAATVSAQVVALDKKTRTMTLKGPQGRVVDIVAGDEVKNFDKIKPGDFVVVRFMQSLALELQKVKTGADGITASEGAIKAGPNQRPGAAAAREITAIAKVTEVNEKAKKISMRGPRGNVVTFDVQNPDQFKVVKVGDEVLVTYSEAVAVSVEPGAPKAAKSAKPK